MSEFSDSQISEMAQRAETIISDKIRGIVERYSVAVTEGIPEYSLPNNIIEVTRVLWKGKVIEFQRTTSDLILSGSTPLKPTEGTPVEYFVTYVGVPVLKLYPSPNETLSKGTGDLWAPSVTATCLTIEATVVPDFTSETIRIPSYIRRQYVKDYVSYRLLKREGKLMDPNAAQYFQNKFDSDLSQLMMVKSQLMSCIPLNFEEEPLRQSHIGRPVLPPIFGEVCE